MGLKELKTFFNDYKYTSEHIKLNESDTVKDQRKFVESHLKLLESNSGNKGYLPYYNRLVLFHKIITAKK